MRVTYDETPGCEFPLSGKTVRRLLRQEIAEDALARVRAVRFGCNAKTTQEGRIVSRGDIFDIRINFCLKSGRSRVISDSEKWLRPVRALGGRIDIEDGSVAWDVQAARRYCAFLLLHEAAHILYAVDHDRGQMVGAKHDPREESWCDGFALRRALACNLD